MPIWASIHCVTSSFIICQLSLTKNMTKEFKIRHCLQHSWAVVCWAGPRAGNKPSQSFHNHREGPFSIMHYVYILIYESISMHFQCKLLCMWLSNFKLREGSFPTGRWLVLVNVESGDNQQQQPGSLSLVTLQSPRMSSCLGVRTLPHTLTLPGNKALTSAVKRSIGSTTGCTITEKAPTTKLS